MKHVDRVLGTAGRRWKHVVQAMLLGLFMLLASVAASAQGNWEQDTDRMGQDLRGFDLTGADPQSCQDACANDSACKAWTYVKPNTIQGPRPRCWLKSSVPAPRIHNCCISGVKAAVPGGGNTPVLGAACFRDKSQRDLDRFQMTSGDMTPQQCLSTCRGKGFAYAGLQFANWCFCANGYGRYGPADNCNMKCAGDTNQTCGGEWANSVYSVATGTSVQPGTRAQPPDNAPPGGVGCFRDESTRDLAGFQFTAIDMTLQKCVSTCASRGFAFAGAQFSNWCYCGNTYGRYGPAQNCDMKCSGDPDQTCGGGWANSVYPTGVAPGGSAGPGGAAPWQDPMARSLIDEWLRQVERCTRGPHPGSYIDPWARICGRLATATADCSMLPDHPPGWDSHQYVWNNNWCHSYYRFRVQDYVRQRLVGTPAASLAQCKVESAPCN